MATVQNKDHQLQSKLVELEQLLAAKCNIWRTPFTVLTDTRMLIEPNSFNFFYTILGSKVWSSKHMFHAGSDVNNLKKYYRFYKTNEIDCPSSRESLTNKVYCNSLDGHKGTLAFLTLMFMFISPTSGENSIITLYIAQCCALNKVTVHLHISTQNQVEKKPWKCI